MIRPITSERPTQAARAAPGSCASDRGGLGVVERQQFVVAVQVRRPEGARHERLGGPDRGPQSRPGVLVVDRLAVAPRVRRGTPASPCAACNASSVVAARRRTFGLRIGGGACRRDAVQHPVELVVLADHAFVEALDEGTAVIARREHAVVLELDHRLLDGHPTDAELLGDLVAVQPISGAQLPRQDQVHDVRDDQVLLFDPVLLGHAAVSFSRRSVYGSCSAASVRRGRRATGTALRRRSGRSRGR